MFFNTKRFALAAVSTLAFSGFISFAGTADAEICMANCPTTDLSLGTVAGVASELGSVFGGQQGINEAWEHSVTNTSATLGLNSFCNTPECGDNTLGGSVSAVQNGGVETNVSDPTMSTYGNAGLLQAQVGLQISSPTLATTVMTGGLAAFSNNGGAAATGDNTSTGGYAYGDAGVDSDISIIGDCTLCAGYEGGTNTYVNAGQQNWATADGHTANAATTLKTSGNSSLNLLVGNSFMQAVPSTGN